MRAHLLITAIAGLSLGAAVAAEPVKPPVQNAAQPDNRRTTVVVASVDDVHPVGAAVVTEDGVPVKRQRRARVNSCRCGDQAPNE
jgi:hypothetical protein